MNETTYEPLNLTHDETSLLAELLEAACARLRVEINHTDHRAFRDQLRHRLTMLEAISDRISDAGKSSSMTASGA
jgi:hypothetical protein